MVEMRSAVSESRRGALRCLTAGVLFGAAAPAASQLAGEMSSLLLAGLLYLGGAGRRPVNGSWSLAVLLLAEATTRELIDNGAHCRFPDDVDAAVLAALAAAEQD